MLSDFSPLQLLVLGALVFFAGVVDALAGGGGLITLPAYLSAGLDPALLLGTNKLSSSIGTVMSAGSYLHRLRFPLKPFLPVLAASLAGSALGAAAALLLDPCWVRWLLLAALPVIAYLLYVRRGFGGEDRSAGLPDREVRRRAVLLSSVIGAYDGFFGPGTGTFFALALARWCRYDLLGATARAKALNLASNLAALALFLWSGRLDLGLGLAMGGVSIAGHWLGAHLGLRRGAQTIRPVVIAVCAGLFAKLVWDAASPHLPW